MAENDDFTPMFGKGAPNKAFAQYFIGNSYLNPLTSAAECGVGLANVTFEPVFEAFRRASSFVVYFVRGLRSTPQLF